jgi:hypothetical protein
MNVLVSFLESVEPLAEGGLAFDAFQLLQPLIVPAGDAAPGTVGLLAYEAQAWDRFSRAATPVDARPHDVIAVAGMTAPDREHVIVAPDPDGAAPVFALWLSGEDDILDVMLIDVREDLERFGPLKTVREFLDQGRQQLRPVDRSRRCVNRRSTLACAARDCESGDCRIESWYDEKRQSELYACVCK